MRTGGRSGLASGTGSQKPQEDPKQSAVTDFYSDAATVASEYQHDESQNHDAAYGRQGRFVNLDHACTEQARSEWQCSQAIPSLSPVKYHDTICLPRPRRAFTR